MASAARQPCMEDILSVARSQTNPPVTIKIHYYNKATGRHFECAYHTIQLYKLMQALYSWLCMYCVGIITLII